MIYIADAFLIKEIIHKKHLCGIIMKHLRHYLEVRIYLANLNKDRS